MKINHLADSDGGDYAWIAEGHVDLAAFCRELAELFPDAAGPGVYPPLHTHIRATEKKNKDGLETEEFCPADFENARPVTAVVADDYWDSAAAYAVGDDSPSS